ncbi:Hypothetical protein PENO1_094560 [Penicillium occitanis (nom. inval.)]|nr:Hypothetical protein PENO1_094560 [Penicillium occitanis (nom. inval.)]PCG91666.1 hypothetical protein PENOC_096280 [Penicillium occitanis (nom. inval.)]
MFDFVRLPGEIRNVIYKNLLVEDPVIPWAEERPWVNREPLHINLAYTTKAIHDEWTSIFYSETTFDFRRNEYACGFECSDDACELPRTARFLERIGRNARHIRHILTQFPDYYYDKHRNEYRLFGHSSRLVDMFQIKCPSLKRLCFGPICSYSESTRQTAFNNEAQAAMLLSLIDRHFRTITSLETIAVKVPDCDPSGFHPFGLSKIGKSGMNLSKCGGFISTLRNFSGICNLNGINLSNFGNKSELSNLSKADLTNDDASNRNLNKVDLTNDDANNKSSKIVNLSRIGNFKRSRLDIRDPQHKIRLFVYKYLPNPPGTLRIYPRSKKEKKLLLHVNLLYTNKTVYQEYRAIFYANIQFDFASYAPDDVCKFLDQIGSHNARHIRCIYMDFPCVCSENNTDELFINGDSARVLDRIQKDCISLKSLTFDLYEADAQIQLEEMKSDHECDPENLTKLLSLVNSRLRVIPSLESIVCEVVCDEDYRDVFREMKDIGWEVDELDMRDLNICCGDYHEPKLVTEDVEGKGWPDQVQYDMLDYRMYDDDYSDSETYDDEGSSDSEEDDDDDDDDDEDEEEEEMDDN